MIKKIFALIKKDFLIECSYKFSFLLSFFTVIASILTYYFIDKLFGWKMAESLQEFGVSYFSYVLLSMAFFSYIIEEYINNSEIMVQVVSDILEKRKLRSSRLLKNKRKTAEMGRTNYKNVFLSEEEISDVYDILERYDIDEV